MSDAIPSTDRTVYELFDEVATRTPNVVAIRHRGTSCTYGELAARAMTLARRLPRADEPPAFVILLDNKPIPETSAILAALAVGGVAAPLDAQQPAARLASVVSHCAPTAILATAAASDLAAELARHVPVLVIPEALEEGERVAVRTSPDADAYVCYTSGSTGQPKGLVATHRQLVARALATASALTIRPDDRHTALNSAAVGAGCSTLWRAFLTGGMLLPRRVSEEGVERLLEWLNTEEATILACSPALFRTFISTLAPGDLARTVRLLRIGGERVTAADHGLFKRHFPVGALFVNAYSCTEASNVTLHLMTHESVCDEDPVPVGQPLPGCRVSILDQTGNILQDGSVGEIAVEGPFLSRGFFREDDVNLFETVDGKPGTRRLRTGDIGRLRADGSLVHLGRQDFRVKIRGFRVEIEAIETVLQQAPGVRLAAVIVRDMPGDAASLMAYVITDGNVTDTEQLRAHARAHLPTGSVPHGFAIVDQLPLTASGKVDRMTLRALDEAKRADPIAAATATFVGDQAVIAEIWRDLLGHARFGADDDFMSLGGDSLSAMRVLTRIRQLLEVEIAIQTFLGSPTVAALAIAVGEARRRDADLDERELRQLIDEIENGRSRPGG